MTPEARDAALTISLIGACAALVTFHVVIVFGLARRRHFAAAIGSLLVPPLAPYCAFTQGMPARAAAWSVSAAIYLAAFLLSR